MKDFLLGGVGSAVSGSRARFLFRRYLNGIEASKFFLTAPPEGLGSAVSGSGALFLFRKILKVKRDFFRPSLEGRDLGAPLCPAAEHPFCLRRY